MKLVRAVPLLMGLFFLIDATIYGQASIFGHLTYNAGLLAAAFIAFKARQEPRVDSIGALALSLAIFSWAIGSIGATLAVHLISGPFSSLTTQNAFYLLIYPLGIIAINRLLSRRAAFSWQEALNAIIVGLGIASVITAIGIEILNFRVSSENFIDSIFPVGDLVLISYILASWLMLPKRNSPRAVLLALGVVTFVLVDFYYLRSVFEGTYVAFRWPDVGWLIGFALVAEAPWRFSEERQSQDRGAPVELVAAVAALAILSLELFGVGELPWYALTPAIATVIFAFIRLAFALQQSQRLLDEQLLARTDELTGLANRRRFVNSTAEAVEQWQSSGIYGSLLLLDLDGFKEVNDTLGHQTGDELLRNIASRLQGSLPRNSLLARLGGDEFGLILFNTSDAAGALTVAGALRAALAQPIEMAGVRLRADASIGIALAPDHGMTVSDLLRHADVAMYRAKRNQLGAAIFDPAEDTLDGERLNLAEELADAVRHDQLSVYYQPKIDLLTGRVDDFEALLRWQHPRLGLLTPPDFMDIAARTGIIVDITRLVLKKVGEQLEEWRSAGLDVTVAVNITARELEGVEIVQAVQELITTRRLTPDALVLEITEELLVKDAEYARTVITALDRIGVRVAIDDFGTGYSSLSYLQHLPVHELKLDKAFVAQLGGRDAEAAGRARAVAKSVIDLGRSLGMQTSAEGVEQEDQLAALRAIGCDTAQGFLFAPPLTAVSATLWLATKVPVALPTASIS